MKILAVLLSPAVSLVLVYILGQMLGGYNPVMSIIGFLVFWALLEKSLENAMKEQRAAKKKDDSAS